MANKRKDNRKACSTEQLEENERKANKILDELMSDPTIPEFLTPDDEMLAAIRFFEHRTSAIAKYSDPVFVDQAVESLKKRFAKRIANEDLDSHLRRAYEDMYNDVDSIVQDKRAYYIKRITTDK